MRSLSLGLGLGLMLVFVFLVIITSYKLIDNYNHVYIPVFTDAENEIICIEEGIE